MKVAIHELKAGLSRHLARARAGEDIVVTSHDRPIARIVGIAAGVDAGLARWLASGQAQWRGGKPALTPPVRLGPGGRTLADTVLEDRG
jgi:prevent-host-death family protein